MPQVLYSVRNPMCKQEKLISKMYRLRQSVESASKYLNKISGWDHIEAFKKSVHDAERAYSSAKALLRSQQAEYSCAMSNQNQRQKDINTLLQRKHSWTSADVQQFTHLYAKDHEDEMKIKQLRQSIESADDMLNEAHSLLITRIGERYREEQLWTDRLRSYSTYGTFALTIVNISLFLIMHGLLEPRKKKIMLEDIRTRLSKDLDEQRLLQEDRLTKGKQSLLEEIEVLFKDTIITLNHENKRPHEPPEEAHIKEVKLPSSEPLEAAQAVPSQAELLYVDPYLTIHTPAIGFLLGLLQIIK